MLRKLRQMIERRQRRAALEAAIEQQLSLCVRGGVNDAFQRGYVCALYWTWTSAGYSDTPASIAAKALVEAGVILSED